MIDFETDITICRPITEVFDYVSNAQNNAKWNSAVISVEPVSGNETELNREYRMHRIIGRKKVENLYRVTGYEKNKVLTIRTLNGPTPFTYTYSFEPAEKGTHIHLDAKVKEDGLPFKAPSFVASYAIKRGVNTNLETLKRILEANGSAC